MAGTATRPPLSVALCFGTYPPQSNGGSDFLLHLAKHLVEVDVRPVVITSPAAGEPEHQHVDGVTVCRVVDDWRFNRRGLRASRRIARAVGNSGVDVVHVLFPDSEVEAAYQIPALVGWPRPLVTTFWSLGLGMRSPTALRFSALALLARSAVLTSHDPDYLRQLRRLAFGRPVRWLPVGSNVGGSMVHTTLDPSAEWLAYFGQLDSTRGVEDLFAAVARLRRGGRNVRVLMIGSGAREERYASSAPAVWGDYQRLRHMPEDLGIGDAVEWTPYLPDVEVTALLAAATACVFPYRRNSIGRSALAAAFEAGAPVILAGEAEAVGPLEPDRHVALVPRADPEALARAIEVVLDDPVLRSTLRGGSRSAARFFAWPRIAATARSVYEEALGSGP